MARSPWSLAARWASSPRDRARSGTTLARGVDVDPEQHLEVQAGPFALGDELGQPARHAPDLLEVPRRGRQVHDRPVLRVGHGDDRRHDAGPVAEPLVDAERPLEDLRRSRRAAGRSATPGGRLDVGPRRDRRQELAGAAGQDLVREPRASPREVDHPDLAKGGSQAAIVGSLLGELDGAAVGLFGAVEVDLDRGAAERLAERAPQERLAELEGRSQLHRGVAPLGGRGADASGELRGGILVVAHPQRRRAPQLDIELDGRIAHRLGEGGQLGQSVEPLAGLAQDRERVVAGREQDPPVGGRSRRPGAPARRVGAPPRGHSSRGPPSPHRSRTAPRGRVSPAASACWASIGRPAGAGSPPSSSRSTTAAWTCRRRAADSWLAANWRTCSWVNV